MSVPELLHTLLTTPGPSGHESRAAEVWRQAAGEFAEVTTDAMGSSFARVRGRSNGPTVAIMGHIDECGIVVTHVEESGVLSFAIIGGYNLEVLVGQRVQVLGRGGDVPGFVMRRRIAPEAAKDGSAVRLSELHVEIGARDAEEALSLVRVGDVGVLVGDPVELPNGRIASKALDNRAGAYVALEALRRIAEAGGAPGDVVAVASVQEEIGLFGARTSAYGLRPDVAIVVDITPSSDIPGGDHRVAGKVGLGDGPVLDRAPSLNPRLVDLLVETAEREEIALCYEISTRATHTDADEIHLSRAGVPTALVSIPLRYAHTAVETAQLSDLEDTIRLLVAAVRRIDAETSFAR